MARLTETACPAVDYARQLSCFSLQVPENRSVPTSRGISLGIAVLKATGRASSDPVLVLQGGPGEAAIPEAEFWLDSPIRADRDIIFLDQRGTGLSSPLKCPEVAEAIGQAFLATGRNPRAELDVVLAAGRACYTRLTREGFDLNGYDTTETVADIAALQAAMAIETWNLYSVSYGTRVAQQVMRDAPESLRSVVLDSGSPAAEFETVPSNLVNDFEAALSHFFHACAADRTCARGAPRLPAAFDRMIETYNRRPYREKIELPSGDGAIATVEITGSDLAAFITLSLKEEPAIPILPALIMAASRRNGDVIRNFVVPIIVDSFLTPGAAFEGAGYLVDCADNPPRLREGDEELLKAKDRWSTLWLASSNAMCSSWPVEAVPSWFYETNRGDVPTLIFAGAFDPVSLPREQTRAMAAALPDATVVEIPSAGHVPTFTNECAKRIMRRFYRAPDDPLDTACAEKSVVGFVFD